MTAPNILDLADFRKRRAERSAAASAAPSDASTRVGQPEAIVRPYFNEAAAHPADHRICLAIRAGAVYTVLQYDADTDPGRLAQAAPQVLRLRPVDFNTQYTSMKWQMLDEERRALFTPHAHENITGEGFHFTFCRPQIRAVLEVTENGLWQPDDMGIGYTVDETGWRKINRSSAVTKGELIIEYVSGHYDHGPREEMLKRLAPKI